MAKEPTHSEMLAALQEKLKSRGIQGFISAGPPASLSVSFEGGENVDVYVGDTQPGHEGYIIATIPYTPSETVGRLVSLKPAAGSGGGSEGG
jgi:hypothetical protein